MEASEARAPDLFKAIGTYTPFGPKQHEFEEYQKLQFIQSNLDRIPLPEVDGFSLALGKLYRWLSTTIDLRIEDVQFRRAEREKLRALREGALAKEAERQVRRENRLAEEMEKWEQAREDELAALEAAEDAAEKKEGEEAVTQAEPKPDAEFDMEAFDEQFDDEDPPVDIPDEVVDDIDNDFNVVVQTEEEEEDEH